MLSLVKYVNACKTKNNCKMFVLNTLLILERKCLIQDVLIACAEFKTTIQIFQRGGERFFQRRGERFFQRGEVQERDSDFSTGDNPNKLL